MYKYWKIYFYLMLVLMIAEYSLRLIISTWAASELYFSFSNQIDLIFQIIALTGLYGFTFRKKIITRYSWKIFFILYIGYIVWDPFNNIQIINNLNQNFPDSPSMAKQSIDVFCTYLLPLPWYMALFIYGFRSKAIWVDVSYN